MERLSDGRYRLSDGRILTSEELAKLHETTPSAREEETEKQELQEGQCSGKILLTE